MLIVISGPSGCGKTTLVKRVLAEMDNLVFSVSHTTRKRRESEVEGRDYYFVTEAEFQEMIRKGAFAEWARVHDCYYGTSRREIEKKNARAGLILDVDIQGAKQIKANYEESLLIFIFPPEFQELKRRLLSRGDETLESISNRLQAAKKEILSYTAFDYIIINGRLEKAVRELAAVILSAGCRVGALQEEIGPILDSFSEDG